MKIQTRILGLAGILLVLAASALAYAGRKQVEDFTYRVFGQKIHIIAETVALTAGAPAGVPVFGEYAGRVLEDPDILDVVVFDRQGRLQTQRPSFLGPGMAEKIRPRIHAQDHASSEPGEIPLTEKESLLFFSFSPQDSGDRAGYAGIIYTVSGIEKRLNQIWTGMVCAFGGLGLGLLLFLFLFLQHLTGRLRELKTASDSLGLKNRVPALPDNSRDELDDLNRSFNELAQRLEKTTVSRDRMSEEQQARKIAEAERDRFFELSHDLFCVLDYEGNLLQTNPACEQVLGFAKEERGKESFLDRVHEEDRDATRYELRRLEGRRKGSVSFANRMLDRSGRCRYLIWNAVSFEAKRRVYATARDVTESKTLEEQLLQSQKMEAVGRLAGGVAHDFNNQLLIIKGYCEFVLKKLEPDTPVYLDVREIQRAAEQSGNLTQQLLTFSRRHIVTSRIFDMNHLVQSLSKMLHRLIREDIELTFRLHEEPLAVKADPGQLTQVLINLVVNARDALVEGGSIIIETGKVTVSPDDALVRRGVRTGSYMVLNVRDNGIGMNEDVLSHLFEPFFTTKEKDKGTGLGLATSFGIVRQSGGHILADSEPDRGTVLAVYLPLSEEPVDFAFADEEGAPAPRGTETILVVEDQTAVRKLAVSILVDQGYQVIQAPNGEAALNELEKSDQTVHLVLSDVIMPRVGGRELIRRIHEKNPQIRYLFMSGYTDDATLQKDLFSRDVHFIQKPFTIRELAVKVREVLNEDAGPGLA